jgi:hypothetical protein
LLKDFNNWCPEIFKGLYIDRVNDDQVRIAPCCQAEAVTTPVDDFDFYTNDYLQGLRREIQAGHKPAACRACWNAEKVNHKSRRQSAIEFYGSKNTDSAIEIKGIDVNSTWACNLSCVMCGAGSSSSWAKELNLSVDQLKKIGRYHRKDNPIVEQLDLRYLEKIHFNGGEPLINQEHLAFLQQCEDRGSLKDLLISYNTNATYIPDEKTIDLWSRARLVKLFFSIDATNSAFNYIRWPANWDQVEKNILHMKDALPSNVMFGFNCTVGAYNIFEIRSVKDWFDKNLSTNRENDQSDFNWQIARNFDPKFLDQKIKCHAMETLHGVIDGIYYYLLHHIDEQKNDLWIEHLNNIDKRRNTCWVDSLYIGRFYQKEQKFC